jgi:hypothetical protein
VQHRYAAMFQKNESNNMNRLENRTSIRSKSLYMYQHFKDRASRMQSESLLSGFAETPPIMERSSKLAFCLSESKGTSISD